MTRELNQHRREASSGKASSVVVFLHGYGADAADLIGLADPLAPHMPDTTFLAPDAPEPCVINPQGFQWFPIPLMDGSTDEEVAASLRQSIDDLNAYLDRVIADEGLAAENIMLFGFSQGTMMSLHVAPRRSRPFAGVVGFSGRLLAPEVLAAETISKPPVLLVHGDADDVVPYASLHEAGQALTSASFEVYAHTMKGTAHGIAPDGLSVAAAFMREKLGIA